jgi:hypothetical protein
MVDQETMNPAVVVEAMRIIDEALEASSCRGIVSASEMIDHFLDLRSLLGPLLTIEA